ncbi:MAG: DUF1735 domain-containing protein [Sphingobacteriaceae bacterium]|nr:MAG: DUF1735 domain-containing protein [Sphingobacteriaceae bacterium]
MKNIINSVLLSVSVLLMSSCLKSTDLVGPTASNGAGSIIEFANPAIIATGSSTLTVPNPRYEFLSLKIGDKVHIDVNYAGTAGVAPNEVTVGLTTDPAALTAHLSTAQANKPTYVSLPSNLYRLPASVIIPAGGKLAGFDFTITDQYTANTIYAVALKISSASAGTISSNFGTIIVAMRRIP